VVSLRVQGDFERICYNALRCNQKRSIIWAAADDLLRRGKKRLEQYEGRGESLVALNRSGGSHASLDSKLGVSAKSNSENVDTRVHPNDKALVPKELKVAISSATIGSAENMPPSSEAGSLCNGASVGRDTSLTQRSKDEKRENQMSREGAPSVDPAVDAPSVETSTQKDAPKSEVGKGVRVVESSGRSSEGMADTKYSAVGQTVEDIDLEGEIDAKSEDHRFDAEGDATESSSSYDSAGSAMEGEVDSDKVQSMFEAESVFRDGNGAVGLLDDDDGLPTSER